MSRVGKMPVQLAEQAKIDIKDNVITVSGPKGTLQQCLVPEITLDVADGTITVNRSDDSKRARAMHGLYRMLVNNMVQGVTSGFSKKLLITGVGFRAEMKNDLLALSLGYSHQIFFKAPDEITIACPDPTTIEISGIDKSLVGQVAAKIRSFRKPEPYRGKGIRYSDEVVRRKEGKTAGKK
ncbi:50S ribosomal protein L6 [Prosthecochloris sp. HL-130-GSB]|jgi:large subunit ribosomal protein L6|uniref:Large ribosomal subunit protein uL6 n=1 Tax=Prosthecochloris aestuarii TaxID=1102 RepID=A0A831SQP1_PROAE|nr:50S ribosomal protein L6 [Prosthecochloris sp. HL-130-GSB]ARM31597.1 50S ribosomal protein L6 [Prosthecochloris sp. HL-130-GSB]MBO8092959.1 50S ribosomal protein L6 [Prosthecochloris sp.]HED31111.1 50S ribosomal protein L6 [Prosthecochloris aestuarii]